MYILVDTVEAYFGEDSNSDASAMRQQLGSANSVFYARSVGFKVGQPVEVSAQDSAVRVAAAGEPRLTLKQKLARFDPERHGGEAMGYKSCRE
jgi:hypothetical protein